MEPNQYMINDYKKTVKTMLTQMDQNEKMTITHENVFQPAKKINRAAFQTFLNTLLLDGSGILGKENVLTFYKNFKEGVSSLIMAEQFHRVMAVPKSEMRDCTEEDLANIIKINMTTQKFVKKNNNNYIFLVYPTGTRSKPWDRSTYKGIREVYNYLKNFEQVMFMSMNGCCMVPQQSLMAEEPPRKDKISIVFSKSYFTKDLIDLKQYSVDKVMSHIYSQKGIIPWDEK